MRVNTPPTYPSPRHIVGTQSRHPEMALTHNRCVADRVINQKERLSVASY